MNNHSFTDEQLLNLVNNTISTKTEFKVEDFTGGSVQVTSTNNHQLIKYRISLYFGYKGKNPISRTLDINEELLSIWQHAMLLKVKFLQTSNNGMGYSDLNTLMNSSNTVVSNIVDSNIVASKGINTTLNTTLKEDETSQTMQDAITISNYLLVKIKTKNINFKNPNINSWASDIEKCLRLDKRSVEQMIDCIDWIYHSNEGSFWIPNILSGKKLREKFDIMNMQVINNPANKTKSAINAVSEARRQNAN